MSPRDHLLGYLGLALMLFAQFGYTWRKRPTRNGPFSMATWLTAHAVAGTSGVLLTLLHGGFRFTGLAGAAQAAAIITVVSGVYGNVIRAPGGPRRSVWYLLHVPFSAGLLVLVVVHIIAVIYYGAGWL